MVNWRIINKFALVSGIVFIVFTVLAGFINYEIDKLLYSSAAPASFIDYTILAAMLPFLAAAVLSFTAYAFTQSAAKSEVEQETETPEKEMQQTEMKPEPEEVFEEPKEDSDETQT